MANFSRKIRIFLKNIQADEEHHVAIVPKSDSCASPGDIVFFKYKIGAGRGSVQEVIFLLIEPITKMPGTGNLLMTGLKLPDEWNYSPESTKLLYKDRLLPRENYRTYRMNRIYGPLHRVRKGVDE